MEDVCNMSSSSFCIYFVYLTFVYLGVSEKIRQLFERVARL